MTHDELQNNSSDTGTKVPMTHDELPHTTENGTPPKGHQESEHAKIIGDAKWLTLAIRKAKRKAKNDPR